MSGELIPQALAVKLAQARQEARTVKKKGQGGRDNDTFRFARSEDVAKEARRLQRKHGIIVLPSAPDGEATVGKTGVLMKVGMSFDVIDADTGEGFTRTFVGAGFDRQGSGAASVATTTATKAFMSGLLGIVFEPDPEERPSGQVAEETEPTYVLNVGSILERLEQVGLESSLASLNLLLGSCNIDGLEESPQPLERRSMELPESAHAKLQGELLRLEQDREALEVPGG